jgi:flagellar protein FlaJ
MMENRAVQKIKWLFRSLLSKLPPHPRLSLPKTQMSQKKIKLETEKPQYLAHRLFGEKANRVLPLFQDLDLILQKSGLKINFKVYISLAIFSTILISFITLALVPTLLISAFNVPLFSALLFGLGGSLFAIASSTIGFYTYPVYCADKFKRELEDELPFTTSYMAILASAGVSPERIFYSLSNLSSSLAVSAEAKDITRDVNLFGLDIISALETASKRTPSEKFHEMLEGFISTIHSGSNLAAYLREKSRQYMKLKRISSRKFSNTLSILSEFYVAILVTGPLLLVIMLAVMGMLGGGTLGFLSPNLLLQILTYLGIPLGSIMFLIILDAVSPKW